MLQRCCRPCTVAADTISSRSDESESRRKEVTVDEGHNVAAPNRIPHVEGRSDDDGPCLGDIRNPEVRKRLHLTAKRCLRHELAKQKEKALSFMVQSSLPLLQQILAELEHVVAANMLKDPDMPDIVRKYAYASIARAWATFSAKVELAVEVKTLRKPGNQHLVQQHDPLGSKLFQACMRIRAFVLWHYMPFDKTIFGKLKDVWFLIACLLIILPITRPMFFGIILLMIRFPGPADEFQLQTFILNYKGVQFILSGVLALYNISIRILYCFLRFHGEGVEECYNRQMSSFVCLSTWDATAVLIVNVSLCWIAFTMLPGSHRRVVLDMTAEEQARDIELTPRGDKLLKFLQYDVMCVAITTVFFNVMYAVQRGFSAKFPMFDAFYMHVCVMWTCSYSLLAFPFAVFIIPGLGKILIHVAPTGFDQQGQCRIFQVHKMELGIQEQRKGQGVSRGK